MLPNKNSRIDGDLTPSPRFAVLKAEARTYRPTTRPLLASRDIPVAGDARKATSICRFIQCVKVHVRENVADVSAM